MFRDRIDRIIPDLFTSFSVFLRFFIFFDFPECIAKGSCFLSWGSVSGGLFAGRFRVAGL
jgi:hypothetical protein